MSKMVGHVDALFGGKRVRLQLARDIPSALAIEAQVGSLYALMMRFADPAGGWTVNDVRTILARAHPEPRGLFHGLDRPRVAPISGAAPPDPPAQRGVPSDTLNPVFAGKPAATYAPLAALVLEAFLLGLRPDRAAWDERTALSDASTGEEAAA